MAKSEKPQHVRAGKRVTRPTGAKRKRVNQPVPTPNSGKMTEKRWADYLANIANGFTHKDAAHGVGLTMATVDSYLISNVAAGGQLRDAKLLWNRREWPLEQIEEVLLHISLGKTMRQAFDDAGLAKERIASLYRIFLQDKTVRHWYDDARSLATESMADEIVDISDARADDRDGEGKILHETINRDRLRVDTRKFLMGKFVPRRFGDTKHHLHEGELNINHAAVLSGGRKRIEKLHAARKGTVVEAEVVEVINE